MSHSSNSSFLASKVVVSRSSESSDGPSQKAPSSFRPSVSEGKSSSSESRPFQTSRLAVIREGLRKKKFSPQVSSLICKARRSSTSTVYNAKWRIFSDWCGRQKVNPVGPSISDIANFLTYLFVDQKLAASTIKGYRAMLSNTLRFRGMKTIGSDPILSELIRSFELARPVSRNLTPRWDLACVLWSLTKSPFEPLDKASLLHLSWKTVFLLTLASAKRRSEIHALSSAPDHLRFNGDGSVTFLCQTGFLAKTQLPSIAPSPFTVPSLSHSLSHDDVDRTLCPVRALHFYLSRVKQQRGKRLRLFIPVKGKGDISKASISRWIASTIRFAYSDLSDQDLSLLQIRPHELRALSTSWAFVNHAPLDDILAAAFWKNSSTFSSFYLRSLTAQQDNLFSLGPLIAAQVVVSAAPPSR